MATAGPRPRVFQPQDISDDWLLAAARRAGYSIPKAPAAGISAWRTLIGAGLSDEVILKLACDASGTYPADFSRASPSLAGLLPQEIALEYRVAPVGVNRGILAIGTVNPKSSELERVLAFASKQRVELQAASPAAILRAQGAIYGTGSFGTNLKLEPQPPAVQPRPAPVSRLSVSMPVPREAIQAAEAQAAAKPGPTNSPASLVDRLLTSALAEHASEAHLEPVTEGGMIVRMRVDGKLNDRFRATDTNASRLISGLKSIAGLDPTETRRPQSGRASFVTQSGAVNVRVSCEPVGVMHERLIVKLFTAQAARELADLGLSTPEVHRLVQMLSASEGALLVAGPPTSGRTTTLYAMLRETQKRGRKVATIEESVTYPLEGVEQTEVSTSPHLTRAAAVRSTFALGAGTVLADLANDPEAMDLIVTGHGAGRLVLGAIGAQDLPGVIKRLYEIHLEPAAIAASLKGVVSQRLVRRLCTACAAPQLVSDLPEAQQALVAGMPTEKLRRPVGCAECRGTGFAGRLIVAELAPMSPALVAAVGRRADSDEITRIARDEGITLLWDAGLHIVLQGATTLGELLDSVQPPQQSGAGVADQGDIDALLAQLLGSQAMGGAATSPASAAPTTAVAPAAHTAATPATPAEPNGMRVLLVDDDIPARRALAAALRERGMRVTEVGDGEAALSYAQRLRPDAIVTEVALPKLDAIGLVQALAASGGSPPIIVYTVQDDEHLHRWLRDAGAKDALSRRSPPAVLIERLKAL